MGTNCNADPLTVLNVPFKGGGSVTLIGSERLMTEGVDVIFKFISKLDSPTYQPSVNTDPALHTSIS